MFEHLRENWWQYWGVLVSVGIIWFQFRKTDNTKPKMTRILSLFSPFDRDDPDNPFYDPGAFGRQIRILLIGLPFIVLASFIAWLAHR